MAFTFKTLINPLCRGFYSDQSAEPLPETSPLAEEKASNSFHRAMAFYSSYTSNQSASGRD